MSCLSVKIVSGAAISQKSFLNSLGPHIHSVTCCSITPWDTWVISKSTNWKMPKSLKLSSSLKKCRSGPLSYSDAVQLFIFIFDSVKYLDNKSNDWDGLELSTISIAVHLKKIKTCIRYFTSGGVSHSQWKCPQFGNILLWWCWSLIRHFRHHLRHFPILVSESEQLYFITPYVCLYICGWLCFVSGLHRKELRAPQRTCGTVC